MEIQITKKEIAVIIFRTLSIYSIIEALSVFAYRFPFLYNIQDEYYLLVAIQVIASSLVLVTGALIIWRLSPFFADSISNFSSVDEEHKFSSKDIHIIIFSAIGMFIVVDALPGIVDTSLFYYQIESLSDVATVDEGILAERNSMLISLILQIVLGIWLIFDTSRIVNYIRSYGK